MLIDALQLEHGVDVKTSEGRQVVGLDAALRTDEGISIAEADLLIAVISAWIFVFAAHRVVTHLRRNARG